MAQVDEHAPVRLPGRPDAGAAGEDVARWALEYARLAPSIHNTQPWRFDVHGDVVDLYADAARAVPVVDPAGRQLVVSCGAALANLTLAVRALGRRTTVLLLPEGVAFSHLARLEVGGPEPASREEQALFAAIGLRRTSRSPVDGAAVSRSLLVDLQRIADEQGVGLHLVETAGARQTVARLTRQAEHAQAASPAFREELRRWSRPPGSDAPDGIPFEARGAGAAGAYAADLPGRNFDVDGRAARPVDPDTVDRPELALLWSEGDGLLDWLRTGLALERILLRACQDGVSGGYANQAVEDPALRPLLRDELGIPGFPQLLLRLGRSAVGAPAPRRPVADFLR